jgi:hypothetical protein
MAADEKRDAAEHLLLADIGNVQEDSRHTLREALVEGHGRESTILLAQAAEAMSFFSRRQPTPCRGLRFPGHFLRDRPRDLRSRAASAASRCRGRRIA